MVNLLEFRGGGISRVILNVEEKERVIKLSASVWGLGTLWLGQLVEQGFEPVKGIATAINCRRNCWFSVDDQRHWCKIRRGCQNHALEKASQVWHE
jgi:hypothetical protein